MRELPSKEAVSADIREAEGVARSMSGSHFSANAVGLFSSLETAYLHDLAACDPTALPRIQAALAQVRTLRRVFTGDENANSRIIF